MTKRDTLNQRLRIVWGNNPPKRYMPRAVHGGPSWRVWDGKLSRFLTDGEVKKLSLEALADEMVLQ